MVVGYSKSGMDMHGGRWIAGRVEYECIPDFLSAHECGELITAIRAGREARDGHRGGLIHSLLLAIDARLCDRLGFEPSIGGVLHARYFDADEASVAADAPAPLTAFIQLNDVERGGELRLGRSGCVLRPRPGTALIARRLPGAWDPRSAPSEMAVRKGFKAVLVRHFAEDPVAPEFDAPALPLQRAQMPQPVFASLREFHKCHAASAADEHVPDFIESASRVPSRLLALPPNLQRDVHTALQPMVEAWTGRAIVPTFVYGVRRYLRGTTLKMHRDRPRTHVYGVSLNIDQQLEDPWPLVVEDAQGRMNEILLRPGELLLYESQRLLHGRPRPLRGDFYAGVFAHFRPASIPASGIEHSAITGCFPCARSR